MSDPMTVTFGFEKRLFRHAVMTFFFSAVPRPSTSYRIVFWLVVWLTVLAAVITIGALKIPPVTAGIGAVIAFGLWILALQRVRMAKFYSALAEHWTRTGDMTATFDANGAHFTQSESEMRFSWVAVDDVVRTKGGTVFRIGMSMITIPDAALPNGMSAKDFRARLDDWRTR